MFQHWEGKLLTVGNGTGTAGITATTSFGISSVGPAVMGSAALYTHGLFGYSAINYSAGQNWTIGIWGNVAGVSVKIAEYSPVTGVSAGIIPLVNEGLGTGSQTVFGTTVSSFIGIPKPRSIILTGSSAGIGISFGVVVVASLGRNG